MDYEIQGNFGEDGWETVNTESDLRAAQTSIREYRQNDPAHPYRLRNVIANETVATWADGYGVWHARINFDGEYTPADVDSHMARLRAKARRAIRREVSVRQATGNGWRCRVIVAERKPTAIEFREHAD